MASTPHAFPDWVAAGAPVVEINNGRSVRATIVRITPSGLVRLSNNATYRLASHGRAIYKTGEQGPWIGSSRPTELLSAAEHCRRQSVTVLQKAADTITRLDIRNHDPADVLVQMQAAVDDARTRLAAIGQKAADAECLAAGSVAA